MKFKVLILQEAEDDIFELYMYIQNHDSQERAEYVFEKLRETIISLDSLPGRGHCPPELLRVGAPGYLEIHFKPYRIIYEVSDSKVFVHAVIDGRRDIQDLLERRLFR
ncbi:type II toxin-antitoxin system RelE/ParE family toxin [Myxococcota bacterium]|nr:type II toxin-antitoxin system RelE/ParE family toxin [Myxococcota bacterium]MBU1536296.1 type II toxin-antitoxin system RelE/ParE family toxin [Myxococcota bacterium]